MRLIIHLRDREGKIITGLETEEMNRWFTTEEQLEICKDIQEFTVTNIKINTAVKMVTEKRDEDQKGIKIERKEAEKRV